jgi:hypothetical protein
MIVAEERRTLPSYLQVGIAKFRFTIKSPLTTSLGLLVLLLRMVWGESFHSPSTNTPVARKHSAFLLFNTWPSLTLQRLSGLITANAVMSGRHVLLLHMGMKSNFPLWFPLTSLGKGLIIA